MNIKELKEWIEGVFPVGPSTDTKFSVTKEPYVTIGIQQGGGPPSNPGIVEQGFEPATSWDEGTACELAWIAFKRYAKGKTGRLYWRQEPKLEVHALRYLVYMRLLISDKPVLEPPRIDRIARTAFEVCRTYNAICMVECGPSWDSIEAEKQAAVIGIVQTILANPTSSALSIHSKWWKAYNETGALRYALEASGMLQNVTKPFEELSKHDRALANLTVAVVRAMVDEPIAQ